MLVLKNKPAWQKGRLNLVGGKVEPGETPQQAAKRELAEETGFSSDHIMIDSVSDPTLCGKILGVDSVIYCFVCSLHCPSNIQPSPEPRADETETVAWHHWDEVKDDPRLIPNLRVIIPLLNQDSRGWTIVDQNSSQNNIHGMALQLEISQPFVNSGN